MYKITSRLKNKSLKVLIMIPFCKVISPLFWISDFIIYLLPPNLLNSWIKASMLKLRGAKIGKRAVIYQGVWIDDPRKLEMGDDVDLSKDITITTGGNVYIGNRCLIGYGSKILSTNHAIPDDTNKPIRFSGHINKPVYIEDDVWICSNVVVTCGVRIGRGAVVAAGAVVVADVEPYTIVGGVPAQLIRRRELKE